MSETDWMYDSLTERFGETLGERQKVVDALLISKAIVGPGPLGGTNSDSLLAVARFILDEWGKCEEDEGQEDSSVLDIGVITEPDISMMKYGACTFPEGSRWVNDYGYTLIFADGKFMVENTMFEANIGTDALPFTRIEEEN